MYNKNFRFLSLLLVFFMVLAVFTACNGSENENGESLHHSIDTTEDSSDIETDTAEQETTEETTDAQDTEETQEEIFSLDASCDEQILHANKLANGVQAYYSDAQRSSMIVKNLEMSVEYSFLANGNQQVSALRNSKGVSYVENTMDTFIRMTDGSTYYASNSAKTAMSNLYRIGYYYYETRYEGQDFFDPTSMNVTDEKRINHTKITSLNQMERTEDSGKILELKTTSNIDPYVVFEINPFGAERFSFLEITMSVESGNSSGQVYVKAGGNKSFSANQCVRFNIIPDGEEHIYIIPLSQVSDYTGEVTGLRLDIGDGSDEKTSTIKLSSMKLLQGGGTMPLYLSMNRSFLVYSDKMHQVVQIAATQKTENIAAVGILTEISADRVAKMMVKDAAGEHNSIDGVDWATVEYVAFDIVDAGVFGYILPYDGKGGNISIELRDEVYVIEQTKAPENNIINPSAQKTSNANDFFMGSRVYTDENHDFERFLIEAYLESNPLSEKKFHITGRGNDEAKYVGYDSLRGIYVIDATENQGGFNDSYHMYPNRHFESGFAIRGDEFDRTIYIMTTTTDGSLECAVILDDDLMMLPIPLEVLKNFSEENGERNLYNIDDYPYSEVIFPLFVGANEKYEYLVAHLYQNWGNYPLKQLSGIQFRSPYYHLSTGVTETNCITPWYATRSTPTYGTLPDFRSMSAPFWKNSPQHNSCGDHYWLDYTDSEGNRVRSENIKNVITSYGPTYAEIEMDNISSDGKIAVKYTHMEMPQTDENRSYYTIEYTVIEDVSIKDFKNDFVFYSVNPNDPTGLYKEVGYLNENNECVTVAAKMGDESVQYILGDRCPYFSFFNMNGKYDKETNPTGWSSTSQQGYSNVGFLIYNSSFVIGGQTQSPEFILTDKDQTLHLSLNLGKITLKKGDRFTINAILLPWGSQELDNQYDDNGNLVADKICYDTVIDVVTGEQYKDKSVRNVREDTLLNPLKAAAEADCVIENSVYLPKIRTINGKSAEFTLSGGMNNVAVRISGFEKLTSPKVYEKIDGEWVEIELYSANNRDKMGFAYYYDGYGVQYDGDGTFSYSFVTTMDGENPRTFKIEAFEKFKRWPEIEPLDQFADAPLDVYYGAEELEIPVNNSGYASRVELIEEGGESFLRVYGKEGKVESFVTPYIRSDGDKISGQYIVLKYRVPTTNSKQVYIEFFVSTENGKPTTGDGFGFSNNPCDGEWKVVVIDVSARNHPTFKPDDNGEYSATYLRLDYFNGTIPETDYIDIAYVGMCDTIEEICELNADMKRIRYIDTEEKILDPATGEIIGGAAESTIPEGFASFMGAETIYNEAVSKGTNIDGSTALSEDKGYVTIGLTADKVDSYIPMIREPLAEPARYAVIKYRLTGEKGWIEFFTSTQNAWATSGDCIQFKEESGAIIRDGEWHVLIIDLSIGSTYKPSDDGEYYLKYLRFDPINLDAKPTDVCYVDIAYLGVCADYEDALSCDKDITSVQFFDANGVVTVDREQN